MRNTIKQLEAELAQAKEEIAKWQARHAEVASALVKMIQGVAPVQQTPVYIPYIQTTHPDIGPNPPSYKITCGSNQWATTSAITYTKVTS